MLDSKDYRMSFFHVGYRNRAGKNVLHTKPFSDMTIEDVAEYIRSDRAKTATEQLRLISDHDQSQDFKKLHFEFVTPGGTFCYRNAEGLKQESRLMVLDMDDVEEKDVKRILDIFINNPRVQTAMAFVSPSGHGVKAIVFRDEKRGVTFKDEYMWLFRYFLIEYGIALDKSGSDICRACYLPYDPHCYLNPIFNSTKFNSYDKR